MREHKIAWCLILTLVVCYAPPTLGQRFAEVRVVGGVVEVRADEVPNALSHAIAELRSVCRCVITYEGPEWAFAGDLRQDRDGQGRVVTSTRKGSVYASVPGRLPLSRQTATELLRRLVTADEREGGSARYLVIEGRTIEVRAVRFKDAAGIEVDAGLLLDTPISLSRDRLEAAGWVARIGFELQRRSGRKVFAGFATVPPRPSDPIVLEADNEPAREVLDRLLSQLPYPAGWSVTYTPSMKAHSLFILHQRVQE